MTSTCAISSTTQDGRYQRGLILVILATLAWSTAGFFTRLIALDSWTLLVWRGLFAALCIFLLMLFMQGRHVTSGLRSLGIIGWLYVAISATGMIMFISAFEYTTVAHVSVIYATVPFVAAGLSWFLLGERSGASAIVAGLMALAGVAVMMGISQEGGWIGDSLAFGMTLCLAAMMVIGRRYPQIPVMPAACLSALLSALAALPFSSLSMPEVSDLYMLFLFGVVNSALGLSLFVLGSRYLPAMETALVTALDAPLAPVWVWFVFSEIPSLATLVGGTVVFLAVVSHILLQTRRQQL